MEMKKSDSWVQGSYLVTHLRQISQAYLPGVNSFMVLFSKRIESKDIGGMCAGVQNDQQGNLFFFLSERSAFGSLISI